jgi:hypothetical protein
VIITRWGRSFGAACAALLLAGCAASVELSVTNPSATNQLLVFRALERAAANLDLTRLRGRRVALEVISQLDDQKSAQRFAAEYLETWMRAHCVAVGADHPELRLQAYLLTLGSDRGRTFLGIPAFQLPVLSVPVPEIALFKWQRSRGRADIRVYAFDAAEEKSFREALPDATGRSKFDDFTVLVVVDFTVTDVDEPLPDMPPPALPMKLLLPNNSTACPKSRSNPNNGIHLTASLNCEGNSRSTQ